MLLIGNSCSVHAESTEDYNGSFEYIAYSAVRGIGDAPANSVEHFKHCCSSEYSYDMLKGDLVLTSDNKVIMCHDPGFTLNSKGRIIDYNASSNVKIRDMTYEECLSLKYEEKYKGTYAKVCSFEQFLSICASHRKKAYITIREADAAEAVDAMMAVIDKYDMRDNCVINTQSEDALEYVREKAPEIRISLLLKNGRLGQPAVDKADSLGNCLLTLWVFPGTKYGGLDSIKDKSEMIAYANGKGIDVHVAILDDVSCINELKKYGISGAQIKIDSKAPVYLACGKIRITSVANKSATFVSAANRRKIVIPESVKIQGKTYRVTSIEADAFRARKIRIVEIGKNISRIKKNAFRGSNTKTAIIKSRYLRKANIKNAFRGSRLKCVKIRVGSKTANKRYAIKYKFIIPPKVAGRPLRIRY